MYERDRIAIIFYYNESCHYLINFPFTCFFLTYTYFLIFIVNIHFAVLNLQFQKHYSHHHKITDDTNQVVLDI